MTSPVKYRANPGPQERFTTCGADIVVYGGAAGGGKTRGALMDLLRYVHEPRFRAVIFRRTSPQITSGGGLWDEAMEFYPRVFGKRLKLNQGALTVTFPTGAKLAFRHMQHEKNVLDWQGSQLGWIGFDEATHFTWKQVNYLISRMRSKTGIRTKMRLTTNPDAESWLAGFLAWWIDPATGYAIPERSGVIRWMYVKNDVPTFFASKSEAKAAFPDFAAEAEPLSVAFIPSSLDDTPQLAGTGYKGKLLAQTEVERERLLRGNWKIVASDGLFKREWFAGKILDAAPAGLRRVRAWDLAATEASLGNDPDYTAGALLGRDKDGRFFVLDVCRTRSTPRGVIDFIRATADRDGKDVPIRFEEEGGSGGKFAVAEVVKALAGYRVQAVKPTTNKAARAGPLASQAEAGNVFLVRGPWNDAFLGELSRFPVGNHDDQVDAAAYAFAELTSKRGPIKDGDIVVGDKLTFAD